MVRHYEPLAASTVLIMRGQLSEPPSDGLAAFLSPKNGPSPCLRLQLCNLPFVPRQLILPLRIARRDSRHGLAGTHKRAQRFGTLALLLMDQSDIPLVHGEIVLPCRVTGIL
jgi:hypothetical protein